VSTRSNRKPAYDGPYRKPRADVYTVALVLALLALLLGILCLYAQMATYNYQIKGGPTLSSLSPGEQGCSIAFSSISVPTWRST